ncbi:MAG: cytochrome c oxidase assembly protein [Microvirga sp.]|jgi:cytochrome c oxidase assembly protein subunit 11|uniref:Cytochrome c oxidase assembly protein CtaG n=1 Tax=Microvirga tunisiensis TaxID=2108360 RepID=A0A5N7MFX7_9HYPH|nr:cytochrome c oxidase assembly protein [Microvirga tunisiensis]MPR07585.1 cytochrome c oxidase assembly protein [Microvirga tunisiensis]MPR25942.1 cytochrome c oxidase assembly protein [Microvirga tunisiensis]
MAETSNLQRKMHRTAFACVGVAVGMVGLAYASVPLYDLFCKVTGFGGTPIVRDANGSEVMDRTIAVRFDSNVAPGLNWRFAPEKPEVKVKLGETTTVYYKVTNTGDKASTGIATYNVQPDLAGTYFSKLECFCFTEQTLQPGETLESAVVFYVDPRLVQDPDVKDLTSLTLSYTYFPSKGGKPVAEVTSSTKPIAQ